MNRGSRCSAMRGENLLNFESVASVAMTLIPPSVDSVVAPASRDGWDEEIRGNMYQALCHY